MAFLKKQALFSNENMGGNEGTIVISDQGRTFDKNIQTNACVKSQPVIPYTEDARMSAEKSFSRADGASPDGSQYTKIRTRKNLR